MTRAFSSRIDFKEADAEFSLARTKQHLQIATFAGGCFWCMEGPFEAIEGVEHAIVGYVGGSLPSPSYEQVCSDQYGHREGLQVFFDPTKVVYRQLLELYFWNVDPTDPQGQFSDRGFHYTTAIFASDNDQTQQAKEYIRELALSGRYDKPMVTEVLPAAEFYPAEDYHQQFYLKSRAHYLRYKKGSGREDYIFFQKQVLKPTLLQADLAHE